MRVQLDHEVWEVADHVRLEEVLANLSDRAQAQGRLITRLTGGNRTLSDRDLVPQTLSQPAKLFAPIAATSEQIQRVVQNSEKVAHQFMHEMNALAQELVEHSRSGKSIIQEMDRWLGQMADLLEWVHIHDQLGLTEGHAVNLQGWMEELMNARQCRDMVRVADILEYEIIPLMSKMEVVAPA